MRLESSHLEWPVTMMTNARETSESRWNLPKVPFPSVAFYDTHAKTPTLKPRRGPQTLLQARHLCQASWQISSARTYWKYALAHMWQQHNVHRPSTWFRAELKKHGWSKHSWLFLTESRNSINAQGYQPFTLSLSIYSCSTARSFEWNHLLSWLTSFTRTFFREEMLVFAIARSGLLCEHVARFNIGWQDVTEQPEDRPHTRWVDDLVTICQLVLYAQL